VDIANQAIETGENRMKLSEYILKLNNLLESEGDIEVLTRDPFRTVGAYQNVPLPEVAYKAVLNKRERTPRFHGNLGESELNRGEKVVRI
jgi:hypothetical protein